MTNDTSFIAQIFSPSNPKAKELVCDLLLNSPLFRDRVADIIVGIDAFKQNFIAQVKAFAPGDKIAAIKFVRQTSQEQSDTFYSAFASMKPSMASFPSRTCGLADAKNFVEKVFDGYTSSL